MVEGASGDRSMQTALCAGWYDAEGGRRRDYVTVMLGLSLFVTNLSPRGCWRAVGTQCEPVGSEYEPARSDSVTECEPGKGDVCKPACGYLRAATGRKVARPTQGGAGRGVGQSERRPVVGRIRVATSPGAQAS